MMTAFRCISALLLGLLWPTAFLPAQSGASDPGRLRSVARELMIAARYAALITVDSTGAAQARTMDPFAPDEAMVVWFATNPRTRKVAEITRDPRVTLYYFSTQHGGYVTLRGRARLVNDPVEKERRWKAEWAAFYPDRERDYLLVVVTPERLEIVSPGQGIVGDSLTWRPPTYVVPRGKEPL